MQIRSDLMLLDPARKWEGIKDAQYVGRQQVLVARRQLVWEGGSLSSVRIVNIYVGCEYFIKSD